MAKLLSLEKGQILVKLARLSAQSFLERSKSLAIPSGAEFDEMRGAFVTVQTFPEKELRGCIGFVTPSSSLAKTVCEAAVHAISHDTRFEPVKKDELPSLVFEVSVLTPQEPLAGKTWQDRLKSVKVGRDGLIIQYGYASGLLLPQVPIEWNWDAHQFLEALCSKAGLPRDMWKSPSAKIYSFQAQVFDEEAPEGKIIEKKLMK